MAQKSEQPPLDYQTLLQASPNAYLLLMPDLTIVDANSAHSQLVGMDSEQLIGRYCFDVFPGKESVLKQRLLASFDRVLQEGVIDTIGLLHYPIARNGVQGPTTWDDRYWTVSNIPILDSKGRVSFILNHIDDVTDLLHTSATDLSDEDDYHRTLTKLRVNQALRQEQRRFRRLLEQAPGFVAILRGPDHRFELANNAYYKLIGHRDILGKTVRQALPELKGQGFHGLLDRVYQSGEPFIGRAMPIQFQHETGSEPVNRYLDFIYQPIVEQDKSISGIFVQGHDVTEAHELSQQVSYQAAHDPLTGLVNRREFEQRLADLLDQPTGDNALHSLIYLDLDQFKVVNDTCGHSAGDELLRYIAMLLSSNVDPADTLARFGGDEFVLLLEYCPERKAAQIANTLREVISEVEFSWDKRIFGCSASLGLITFAGTISDSGDVLSAADAACFLAKENGRNRLQVYHSEDREFIARRREMDWITRLRRALRENRILLYAQRIEPLSAQQDSTQHWELLIRLQDDDDNLVPPMAYIPAAERYGFMPSIDRFVVEKAFIQLQALDSPQRGNTILSINLSGTTLNDEDFLPFIEAMLKKFDVDPRQICFELTETAVVANLTHTIESMSRMKRLGFRFSLDDFGSGMSSFSYLKRLPVDCLKIDGSFITHLLDDEIDLAMVQAIARVARVMRIDTIAEFVESAAVRDRLARIGVTFAQGFAIHRPEPLQDCVEGPRATGT